MGEGDAVEQLRRRGDQVVDLAERVGVLEGEQDLVHPVVRIEIVQVVEVTVPFQHVDQVPDRHRSVAQELQGRGADPGVLGLHVPVHMVDGTPVDRRMSDRSHRSAGRPHDAGTFGPGAADRGRLPSDPDSCPVPDPNGPFGPVRTVGSLP